MRILSLLVAAFALFCLVASAWIPDFAPRLLGGVCLLCALSIWLSQKISSFLKIFIGIFAVETIVFGLLFLFARLGLWPHALSAYILPDSLSLSVAIFAILIYAVSHFPVVRAMTRIADGYFETGERGRVRLWPLPAFTGSERRIAVGMIIFLVLTSQALVGVTVRLSFFNRYWFNAIQTKNEPEFWRQLLQVFLPWAFVYIAIAVADYVVRSMLVVRWRRWLTARYVGRWLDGSTHYRMSLIGLSADNPDQRIAEDINRFIDGGDSGYGIYSYTIMLISTLSSLVSFSVILWGLSANFTLPGTNIAAPGFLFWVALVYAAVGTVITHLIGRSLVGLFFTRQRFEANFRFSLARLREYGEQVALLKGEPTERRNVMSRFGDVFDNYLQIIARRKLLIAFTAFYGQISPIIPYVLTAPFYFLGKVQLGVMTQTASAFGNVGDSLNFFVTYYTSLADFRSVLERLRTFDEAIERARILGAMPERIEAAVAPSDAMVVGDLTLGLPDGRKIVTGADLAFEQRHAVLVNGPSGSGKSTLFRAIAGIWPYGHGRIATPSKSHVMVVPQKPYFPIGTLRAAIVYPGEPEAFSDAEVRDALAAARLPDLAGRLEEQDNWSQRLSGGEQQRVAIARALLAKPDWLFLDEATSALDELSEAALYKMLADRLPKTTIVSIGHRSTLAAFHDRRVEMRPAGEGAFRPAQAAMAIEAAGAAE
ncbi:MAG TPA: ABC transporter ATP-binding protein/permease [Beijerinckiaceae bacterium]|nr:ABC transporter ATP-binding protein/permease [Beijerinckiaceae bacterium]